jgi:hypothetical protein
LIRTPAGTGHPNAGRRVPFLRRELAAVRRQLAASDSDLRLLFANGAPAAAQLAGLITDNAPTLRADRELRDYLADHAHQGPRCKRRSLA